MPNAELCTALQDYCTIVIANKKTDPKHGKHQKKLEGVKEISNSMHSRILGLNLHQKSELELELGGKTSASCLEEASWGPETCR